MSALAHRSVSRSRVDPTAALNILYSMFEQIDRDVIKAVLLEGCEGNMEAAVEALLGMCSLEKNNSAASTATTTSASSLNRSNNRVTPPSSSSSSSSQTTLPTHQNFHPNETMSSAYYNGHSSSSTSINNNNYNNYNHNNDNNDNNNNNMNSNGRGMHPLYVQQQQWLRHQQQLLEIPDDFLRPPSYFINQMTTAHNPSSSSIPNSQETQRQITKESPQSQLPSPQRSQSQSQLQSYQSHQSHLRSQSQQSLVQNNGKISSSSSLTSTKKKLLSNQISNLFKRKKVANGDYQHLPSSAPDNKNKNKNKNNNNNNNNNNNGNVEESSISDSIERQGLDQPVLPNANSNSKQPSFKEKFSSLSINAKEKFTNFADKLKIPKDSKPRPKTTTHDKQKYVSAFTSLDDDSLHEIDVDHAEPHTTADADIGTYIPPSPSQEL